jgi:hypothetical protein
MVRLFALHVELCRAATEILNTTDGSRKGKRLSIRMSAGPIFPRMRHALSHQSPEKAWDRYGWKSSLSTKAEVRLDQASVFRRFLNQFRGGVQPPYLLGHTKPYEPIIPALHKGVESANRRIQRRMLLISRYPRNRAREGKAEIDKCHSVGSYLQVHLSRHRAADLIVAVSI